MIGCGEYANFFDSSFDNISALARKQKWDRLRKEKAEEEERRRKKRKELRKRRLARRRRKRAEEKAKKDREAYLKELAERDEEEKALVNAAAVKIQTTVRGRSAKRKVQVGIFVQGVLPYSVFV